MQGGDDLNFLKNLVMPPWIAPLLAALLIGALFYTTYSLGVDNERTRWQGLESKKLVAANQKILDLHNQKYDLEQLRVKDAMDLTLKFNQEMKQNEDNANAVIADLRAGARKLRIATVRPAGGDCTTSQASATVSGAEPTISAELSQDAAEFLVTQASRADEVTLLFNRCQAQLVKDREPQGD